MSEARKDSGIYAFPIESDIYSGAGCGLTKREWFAGMALQGILANPQTGAAAFQELANEAYQYADAMLEEGGYER